MRLWYHVDSPMLRISSLLDDEERKFLGGGVGLGVYIGHGARLTGLVLE